LLLPAALLTACQQEESGSKVSDPIPVTTVSNVETPAVTSISFSETAYKFGEVKKDVPVRHRFTFTNTGTADLILETVKPACSCTVTEYTKEAVKPGESGYIDAEFGAKALGKFSKTVTVTANTEPRNVILAFEGEVVE
jgi:hypothetical protein